MFKRWKKSFLFPNQVASTIKYTGNGYVPCKGYAPTPNWCRYKYKYKYKYTGNVCVLSNFHVVQVNIFFIVLLCGTEKDQKSVKSLKKLSGDDWKAIPSQTSLLISSSDFLIFVFFLPGILSFYCQVSSLQCPDAKASQHRQRVNVAQNLSVNTCCLLFWEEEKIQVNRVLLIIFRSLKSIVWKCSSSSSPPEQGPSSSNTFVVFLFCDKKQQKSINILCNRSLSKVSWKILTKTAALHRRCFVDPISKLEFVFCAHFPFAFLQNIGHRQNWSSTQTIAGFCLNLTKIGFNMLR